eukprot:m.241136 g.241136  ORF g.241136 m.241136 type:complete len:435 (+) comp26298_c0_seq11:592-1896(+)
MSISRQPLGTVSDTSWWTGSIMSRQINCLHWQMNLPRPTQYSGRAHWQADPQSAQRDPIPVVGLAPAACGANPTTARHWCTCFYQVQPHQHKRRSPSDGEHQSSTAPGVGHTEFDEDAIADIATVSSSNHKLDVAKEGEREKQNGKQQAQLQPHAKKRRGNLPADAVRVMKAWILRHEGNPYPSGTEKARLSVELGLTVFQISNWFINARRRILQLPTEKSGSVRTVEEGESTRAYRRPGRRRKMEPSSSLVEDQFDAAWGGGNPVFSARMQDSMAIASQSYAPPEYTPSFQQHHYPQDRGSHAGMATGWGMSNPMQMMQGTTMDSAGNVYMMGMSTHRQDAQPGGDPRGGPPSVSPPRNRQHMPYTYEQADTGGVYSHQQQPGMQYYMPGPTGQEVYRQVPATDRNASGTHAAADPSGSSYHNHPHSQQYDQM